MSALDGNGGGAPLYECEECNVVFVLFAQADLEPFVERVEAHAAMHAAAPQPEQLIAP